MTFNLPFSQDTFMIPTHRPALDTPVYGASYCPQCGGLHAWGTPCYQQELKILFDNYGPESLLPPLAAEEDMIAAQILSEPLSFDGHIRETDVLLAQQLPPANILAQPTMPPYAHWYTPHATSFEQWGPISIQAASNELSDVSDDDTSLISSELGTYLPKQVTWPPVDVGGMPEAYTASEEDALSAHVTSNTSIFGDFSEDEQPFDIVTVSSAESSPSQRLRPKRHRLEAGCQRSDRTPYQSTKWNCDPCKKGFGKKGDRDRHNGSLHGNVLYRCAHCCHHSNRKDALMRHIRTRHPAVRLPLRRNKVSTKEESVVMAQRKRTGRGQKKAKIMGKSSRANVGDAGDC